MYMYVVIVARDSHVSIDLQIYRTHLEILIFYRFPDVYMTVLRLLLQG